MYAKIFCMDKRCNTLLVDSGFCSFVEGQLLPGLPVTSAAFWQLLESTLDTFVDRNQALIAQREDFQLQIDAFHILHRQSASVSHDDYIAFLKKIGYIEPPAPPFTVGSHQSGLDTEIDTICGPQIVVPVTRSRFALNAANSRWGSLYDVLYGTDAMASPFFCSSPPPPKPTSGFSEARALHVISVTKSLLDKYVPLCDCSHAAVSLYSVSDGQLFPLLRDPSAFVGYTGVANSPTAVLLQHNNLLIMLRIDRSSRFGKTDSAGVSDIMVESSITRCMLYLIMVSSSILYLPARPVTRCAASWTLRTQWRA
jgi:malate synthase